MGSEKRRTCAFPAWLNYHHDWHSVDGSTSIHVNSGHSLKLSGSGGLGSDEHAHVTCHSETAVDQDTTRVVAHIKSGWYARTNDKWDWDSHSLTDFPPHFSFQ